MRRSLVLLADDGEEGALFGCGCGWWFVPLLAFAPPGAVVLLSSEGWVKEGNGCGRDSGPESSCADSIH